MSPGRLWPIRTAAPNRRRASAAPGGGPAEEARDLIRKVALWLESLTAGRSTGSASGEAASQPVSRQSRGRSGDRATGPGRGSRARAAANWDLARAPAVGLNDPELLIDLERFGLPAEPVRRQHQLNARPIAQPVAAGEIPQLADELVSAATRQISLDALLDRAEPKLLGCSIAACERSSPAACSTRSGRSGSSTSRYPTPTR
jgi:hypothetical protein